MSESRSERAQVDGERAQLQAFLDDNRDEVAALLEGMTEEQTRRRLVPSQTTLAGIVKHCTFVEQAWFQVSLLGRRRAELGLPEDADDSWTVDDADTGSPSSRASELPASSRTGSQSRTPSTTVRCTTGVDP